MWLMIPGGFYSIVQKSEDRKDGMLTIRARVENDLNVLRQFIPSLGEIVESENADYRFRARAHKVDFSYALMKIGMTVDYANFKDEVMAVQGQERANTYMGVWSALRTLQFPTVTEISDQPRKQTS